MDLLFLAELTALSSLFSWVHIFELKVAGLFKNSDPRVKPFTEAETHQGNCAMRSRKHGV
jgi:hypothetical protein